jgi:hydroxyacylglutathione hydrolase
MKIRHFNALEDNYMYLISDDKTKECAVVDPAEPDEVRKTKFPETIFIDFFNSNL